MLSAVSIQVILLLLCYYGGWTCDTSLRVRVRVRSQWMSSNTSHKDKSFYKIYALAFI